jgi:hypothetical protein
MAPRALRSMGAALSFIRTALSLSLLVFSTVFGVAPMFVQGAVCRHGSSLAWEPF